MSDPNRPAVSYNPGGYNVCTHRGCSKKAWPSERFTDHACCGNSKHATAHAYRERVRLAAEPAVEDAPPATPGILSTLFGLRGRGSRS